MDLVDAVKNAQAAEQRHENLKRRAKKDHRSIIHKNEEALMASERLTDMGDETPLMIAYVREQFGDEAAIGYERFYNATILKRNG